MIKWFLKRVDTKSKMKKRITLFFTLMMFISCEQSKDEILIGEWINKGRTIIENGQSWEEEYPDGYFVIYEFSSNNTFKTSLEAKGNWKISNDSILIIDIDSLQQKFVLTVKSESNIIMTENRNDIDYIYDFIKKN